MKSLLGPALFLAMVAIPAYVVWRITQGVENWFAVSGAGDVLMWAVVVAMVLSTAAIPVGAFGLAARMWVVRLDEGQHLASTAHTLAAPRQTRQTRQLVTAEVAPALGEGD